MVRACFCLLVFGCVWFVCGLFGGLGCVGLGCLWFGDFGGFGVALVNFLVFWFMGSFCGGLYLFLGVELV